MQYSQTELCAQQLVLAFLGFYKGPIDGIWSGDSISAKRRFECDDAFIPAAPNNGLPFTHRAKLPKGCQWNVEGLLWHRGLTPEKASEILKKQQKQTDVSVDGPKKSNRVYNKNGDGGYVEDGVAYDRKGRSIGVVGNDGPKGDAGVVAEAAENAAE
jgi:hypothetical protein